MSDAKWYIEKSSGAEEEYYNIFFRMCRKYNISWGSASKKERAFISEVTRVTFERKMALQNGIPLTAIRPSFSEAI